MGIKDFLKNSCVCWKVIGLVSRMATRYSLKGRHNKIIARLCFFRGVKFDVHGSNNQIVIGERSVLRDVTFRIRGSGHRVVLGKNCRFKRGSEIWIEDQNTYLEFGEGTSVERGHFALTEDASQIIFGKDCMLATDVEVRTGDSHSILDQESGARINFARNVIVGNHVWIGSKATLLKGVELGDGSIVATGSVVTKRVDAHCVVGGNPARVLKTGVSWERARLPI